MPNPVMLVTTELGPDSDTPRARGCIVWCPGCESVHRFRVALPDGTFVGGHVWDWDGNETVPTFSPSLLCHGSFHRCEGEHLVPCPGVDCGHVGHELKDGQRFTPGEHTADPAWGDCHSFLRAGVWDFLADSAHALAGQQIPMVPLPDWLADRGQED